MMESSISTFPRQSQRHYQVQVFSNMPAIANVSRLFARPEETLLINGLAPDEDFDYCAPDIAARFTEVHTLDLCAHGYPL